MSKPQWSWLGTGISKENQLCLLSFVILTLYAYNLYCSDVYIPFRIQIIWEISVRENQRVNKYGQSRIDNTFVNNLKKIMTTDISVCRYQNPVLSSFKIYHRMCNKSNTTDPTSEAGTAYHFGAPGLTRVFYGFVLFGLWCSVWLFVDNYLSVFPFRLAILLSVFLYFCGFWLLYW